MRSYRVCIVDDRPPHYPKGYFPRQFRYKKEAVYCAKLAAERGATVRVECPNGEELDFRPMFKTSFPTE